ncbi:MAG: cohesin domain-containing protein [Ruminococcus callidus]|nr:cohesin domain-containing protein [Ruminococcus callidus]
MKTLKRTLVALAALTVASMSMVSVASAADDAPKADADKPSVSEDTPKEDTSKEDTSKEDTSKEDTSKEDTSKEETTATTVASGEAATTTAAATTAAAEADNKGDASAATVITVGTVTVKPGTASASVPVTISGNVGFAGTGFKYTFDSKLTFKSVKGDLIGSPVKSVAGNVVALTSAGSEDVKDNGTLYTLTFDLPKDAKAGDVFNIAGSLKQFANADTKDVAVKIVDGAIKVEDEKATTAAATTAASSTKAAAKTVKKAGSSPATGEALPIAGAAAAVAVIGGVAVASRKRK